MSSVAVFLALLASVVASYFSVLYGIKFGDSTVNGWLFSTAVSIVQSIFISEGMGCKEVNLDEE